MFLLWRGLALFFVLALSFNAWAYAVRARGLRRLATWDPADRLGLVDAGLAFLKECVATMAVLVLIPLGWLMARQTAAGTRAPLVLLHGWGLNRGCLWLLRRRLRRQGWGPIYCFEYRTSAGDIEWAAKDLSDYIENIVARGDTRPLTFVGHSLGGLVLRYYARHYVPTADLRLVTIGTPHFGTTLARRSRRLRSRLAPGSALLAALNAGDPLPTRCDVIAIYSSFDALVLPPRNARYPNAFNIELNDVGHNMLLFSKKVYDLLAENLSAPPLQR